MKTRFLTLIVFTCLLFSCKNNKTEKNTKADYKSSYFDYSNSDDQFTGGVKMIPITTPKGTFNVWTKRVGNNSKMKVLLLHGGPGGTHNEFDCFDGYFPNEEIEYIYYDQLDSYYSDKPNDSTLWTKEHFVEEVEQIRKALNLNKDNFYLLGQSWGGILTMEYALKHQDNLKGLIISNMMASAPEYGKYAQEVLGPKMNAEIYKEIQDMEANHDFDNPRYSELLMGNYYTEHILRMPVEKWPKSVNLVLEHLNPNIYVFMQGHSEFGMTGNASLKNWDVSKELKNIKVPTLVIGATHDTMDPKYMKWMSEEVQHGRFLLCPNGSHLSQYDDQKTYFTGLIKFIKDVYDETF
ncbi:proline iminopeptidase [Flaviramulus basaltis]|uniref:Proline iminopeptidase n=1 Tax=Flaviramulus basaltis TaxID=369401 RepID=A0A1K2INT2_9FLAO|nr:proline iminopeptidase-family hydrolase [Flaviramulus basaltis]SFZ93958.1 proline iminopeptidase [Flaviramulus basaltis]